MTTTDVPREAPADSCDVIMKGGITSAVVYPRALCEFARTYRLHGLGGTSAGAIGAVAAAAAEYGRASGGFDRLAELPQRLNQVQLERLFIPSASTARLFRIMKAATASTPPERRKPPRWRTLGRGVGATYGLVFLLALVAVVAVLVLGVVAGGLGGALAAVGWALVVAVLSVAVVATLLYRTLAYAVPANYFGICTGIDPDGRRVGFTDWLHQQVQDLAGRKPGEAPLTFGDLAGREIELRMMTTCLSLGRPYELPTTARNFYYSRAEWARLFPADVLTALDAIEEAEVDRVAAQVAALGGAQPGVALRKLLWRRKHAAGQHLRQLPAAADLPVIVATRLSLSYPLLISAVPMWTVDYRKPEAQQAADLLQVDLDADPPLTFVKVWFTDGGASSNFPVHFFDAALPERPCYIVNLGRFPDDKDKPYADQSQNIEYERDNSWLPPEVQEVAATGPKALAGFGLGAFNTARNWHDNSYLDFPGFRDRIVRVLQTKAEGGLNLNMSGPVIEGLAERGRTAAQSLVHQFVTAQYPAPVADDPTVGPRFTGWHHHQWVRYRALLSALPDWLDGWRIGRALMTLTPDDAPSYRFTVGGAALAQALTDRMDAAAGEVPALPPAGTATGPRADLTRQPSPLGGLHRVPPT